MSREIASVHRRRRVRGRLQRQVGSLGLAVALAPAHGCVHLVETTERVWLVAGQFGEHEGDVVAENVLLVPDVDRNHRLQRDRLLAVADQVGAHAPCHRRKHDVVDGRAVGALHQLEILERALGPGQATQRGELPVQQRSRGRRDSEWLSARVTRRLAEAASRAARAGEATARHRQRSRPSCWPRRSRTPPIKQLLGARLGRRTPLVVRVGGCLGCGVEQQRGELDRGDTVDHAVVGLADESDLPFVSCPRRSTSPTADGRGAAASTSPHRRGSETGPGAR